MLELFTNVGLVSWQGVADWRAYHAYCQFTRHSRVPPGLE